MHIYAAARCNDFFGCGNKWHMTLRVVILKNVSVKGVKTLNKKILA